jgi:SAM-dependent methyltransferase
MAGTGGSRAQHWDEVYERSDVTGVSWFEPSPWESLRMLDAAGVTSDMSVVDVGAGASRLADELVARGHQDVSAVDISSEGLEHTRARLGAETRVRLLVADVLTWTPERTYDVWHDRAVLHFLTDPADQERYVGVAARAVTAGGLAVIGTFAEDGPESCSGLAVARYRSAELEELLADHFAPVASRRLEHRTPWGAVQPFTWVVARRR